MKTQILIIFLSLISCFNLHSQEGEIIYANFGSDKIFPITTASQQIDINFDSIMDFEFIKDQTSGGTYYLFQILSNPLYNFKVKSIPSNDTIPLSEHVWRTSDWRIFLNDYSVEEEYNIGIRQPLGNDNFCYAWLRILFWKDNSIGKYKVTIHDMAYCTVPNYPLRVGQKSFDEMETNKFDKIKYYELFPSPAKDKITLRFKNHYYHSTDNEIRIYGIDGCLIKTQNSNFDIIDISELSSGFYVMKILLGNGETYTEKFVKE